ncbi:META domain-containing protein [Celeribacter sp. SCSIO 80788]|uniref:META domain-containing protein n=1 Tax=Celeribacter sp. SCSIO 80788 TaxID=3117013 RepID=UPI003DA5E73F
MLIRESVFLLAVLSGSSAFSGDIPFGFSTQVACETVTGRVGFAEGAAILDLGGDISLLHQSISASGAKYETEAGDLVFWIKGDEASLVADGAQQTCQLSQEAFDWTAGGNEPGWRIGVAEGRLEALLDYGETSLDVDVPEARLFDGALWYEGLELSLFLRPTLCHDDMTGMPYPESVTLKRGEQVLHGCGGAPLALLSGSDWRIEEIAGQGVIDASDVTLTVSPEGQVSGQAGCNRYTGGVELTGEGLTFGPLASTRMMCPETLMVQEARYFEVLFTVDRFDIDETGALVLYSLDEVVITARR